MKRTSCNKSLSGILTAASIVLMPVSDAFAIPIAGLYSTGVDNAGTVVNPALYATDLHYTITATPVVQGGQLAVQATDTTWGPPWMANTATAGWVVPLFAPPVNPWYGAYYTGYYALTTTFTLNNTLDPLSASFTAKVASDNSVQSILLNGHVVGQALSGLAIFDTITVSSFFVTGLNTLTFKVYNYGYLPFNYSNPTGLLVDIQSSAVALGGNPTVNNVPEPATLALLIAGVAVFGSRHRKVES